jgi:hypothetical protein
MNEWAALVICFFKTFEIYGYISELGVLIFWEPGMNLQKYLNTHQGSAAPVSNNRPTLFLTITLLRKSHIESNKHKRALS